MAMPAVLVRLAQTNLWARSSREQPAKLCHAAAKEWHITAKGFVHYPQSSSLGIWTSNSGAAEPPPTATTVECPIPAAHDGFQASWLSPCTVEPQSSRVTTFVNPGM
ncbi:hypothetical protein N7532_003751 [Penicillium argentinense]|uniref:Uncharacterized protein n=1 Tax=Penicillium argentinense TaxID=1131581 RepID=A0A9W9FNK3_9EURO|nr:uncharacterized protein N7532_003751 [Penicillium argentinense]KAJ5103222.1 hypothetical protein N7532_003751 [Penicillium argentinense]